MQEIISDNEIFTKGSSIPPPLELNVLLPAQSYHLTERCQVLEVICFPQFLKDFHKFEL